MKDETPEESTVQKSHTYKSVLIVTFLIVFILITVVSLSISFYLVMRKPNKPKTLSIYGNQTDPAIYGIKKTDIEKAMELSKGWAINTLKGKDAETEKLNELGNMIISGSIGRIYSKTKCVLLESHRSVCKVQVIEGPMRGLECWVYRKSLEPAERKEQPAGLILGLMCFRYMITASICASILYFLRVKSIFMMFVGFIIGMIILNLIWLRIASIFILH